MSVPPSPVNDGMTLDDMKNAIGMQFELSRMIMDQMSELKQALIDKEYGRRADGCCETCCGSAGNIDIRNVRANDEDSHVDFVSLLRRWGCQPKAAEY